MAASSARPTQTRTGRWSPPPQAERFRQDEGSGDGKGGQYAAQRHRSGLESDGEHSPAKRPAHETGVAGQLSRSVIYLAEFFLSS